MVLQGIGASVMKFDGTNWVYVGNAGFSGGSANFTSLAFGPTGEPYVAFEGGEYPSKAVVMKFNGTDWVYVGNSGFSPQYIGNVNLAFSTSGESYISYQDIEFTGKSSVMKFDGTNWVYVGSQLFSPGPANYLNLALSPTGEPYVAFDDGANSFKASVMKYNGSNWNYIGAPGFSADTAKYLSLTFDTVGHPIVAYSDLSPYYMAASVQIFDSVYVNIEELQANHELSIFPNPTNEEINISVQHPDVISIEVYELNGQKLFSLPGSDKEMKLNVQFLASGIYVVKVTTKESTYTEKFCKR